MSNREKGKLDLSAMTDDGRDISVVTGQCNKTSIDNKTIVNTPDPIAASTVGRAEKNDARYAAQHTGVGLGSFLEANSSTMTSPPEQDSLGRISFGEFSGAKDASRSSSLGLIDVENMGDLSTSMLQTDVPVQRKATNPKSAPVTKATTKPAMPAATAQTSLASKKAKLDIASGGLRFGSHVGTESDHDASVHEIKLDEDDLLQLDEDFSDVGDFDNTLTDESHDRLPGQASDSASGDSGPSRAAAPPVHFQVTGKDDLDEPPPERNPLRKGHAYAKAYFEAPSYVPELGETFDAEGEDLFAHPNDPMGLPVGLHQQQDEGYDEVDMLTTRQNQQDYWEHQRLASRPPYFCAEGDEHGDGEGQEDQAEQDMTNQK